MWSSQQLQWESTGQTAKPEIKGHHGYAETHTNFPIDKNMEGVEFSSLCSPVLGLSICNPAVSICLLSVFLLWESFHSDSRALCTLLLCTGNKSFAFLYLEHHCSWWNLQTCTHIYNYIYNTNVHIFNIYKDWRLNKD